mmetsp:Transcript_2736/g.5159  ORF Transcript_2736/g.5159 Transcript_2736/m.5159 type:complete len:177 (-) Transcript_2736:97-627(-)
MIAARNTIRSAAALYPAIRRPPGHLASSPPAGSASRPLSAAPEDAAEQQQQQHLRHSFTALLPTMSPKVRRLFDLTNSSSSERHKINRKISMEKFRLREGDTGSSAVQVVAMTEKIEQLRIHLATHKKDHNTKRGLEKMVARRRKMLQYMERRDFDAYARVVKGLGLVIPPKQKKK